MNASARKDFEETVLIVNPSFHAWDRQRIVTPWPPVNLLRLVFGAVFAKRAMKEMVSCAMEMCSWNCRFSLKQLYFTNG